MINQNIKNYKITEKIGEGGMGVVYKAYDSKLDRCVALKFLPNAFSSSEVSKKRFMNEAKAASALDHHNTCTIHEIDETEDGKMFIVMPCYDGKPLDVLINDGELDIEKSINIAAQIAEGLKAAHSVNVIHRDIKSGNIFVEQDGHAVIMDFGLAVKEELSRLTTDGSTPGTVIYMSPEQALGGKVDQRTDIWSLGVILYEMLTGKSPFESEYPQATIYCILNEEPEEINRYNPDIPSEVVHIVEKCLKKDPDERYQQAEEILFDLRSVMNETSSAGTKGTQFLDRSYYRSPGTRRFISVSLVVLILFSAGFYFFTRERPVQFEERDWIMITDFENHTDDEVFNHFLGQVLEISMQQSSYMNVYDNENLKQILQSEMQKEDIQSLTPDVVSEAAAFKDVNIMLRPSINKKDGTYLLSADIDDLNTKHKLSLGPYTAADTKNVLAAIDEMARDIRLNLGEPPSQISQRFTPISRATTSSLEALKLYVDGVRLQRTDMATAIELIEQSVQVDPDFAMAQAELGMHYYINSNPEKGDAHFRKALAQSERLTVRERLWIQAIAEDWRGNREEAIRKYRAYLNQYPDDYNAWWRLGYSNLVTQNTDDCIEAFNKVIELEPREASALVNLATCHSAKDQREQALGYYERAFEIRPEFKLGQYVNNEYGFMLAEMGRLADARSTFELMLDDHLTRARGSRNLALLNMYEGRFSDAADLLNEAIRLNISYDQRLSEFRDRMYLARLYHFREKEKEFQDELADIGRLINEQKFGPAWLARMGKIYSRSGRIAEAEALLKEIESRIEDPQALSGIRVSTDDQAFYYMLKGEVELAKKDHPKAVEFMEIARNISFNQIGSLAYAYNLSGDIQKAIECYQEIINKKKLGREYQQEWILAHYQLGKIYEQKGEIEEAIKYYRAFADIWKDGDEDISELKEARDKIQSTGI